MCNTINENIKTIRKVNKLSQNEFSNLIGISQGTLSDIESGKYKPSLETVLSVVEKFDVSLYWLTRGQSYLDTKFEQIETDHNKQQIYSQIKSILSNNGLSELDLITDLYIQDNNFLTNIGKSEDHLIQLFRRLKPRDQEEIISFIEVKINRNQVMNV